ncbi:MBL fold metallo-hydrolase [Segetibacter sp.]|jgi:glyoxylase-like metal-dependent hydrolase (beta-lactamase superfamily II)|uniref:MBL fold metallo-hydrolase n=1 Tax=Segetibacter sp. TaxID=2231182 RepID=UPI0026307604|nr:MBL fold metallo-hydrolase [Segetibacter sp.]MCW3080037.1 fold metallo-hydrolase [Segetibacter sp.]
MLTVKIFTFNPVSVNTYIIYNNAKEALIIDPGCYFEEEKQTLKSFIDKEQLLPVQLLNTHCHLDHIFGNKWVFENYGLELFLHPNEEQVLSFGPQSGKMWGLPFENYEGPLHFLEQDDVIKLGQHTLKVLLAPGHSPGSVCFYCHDQNFIIGGDVLFRESIGRTDLPGGSHQALLASIREQLFPLPDEVIVYPGHGEPTTIGHEKKFNPYLQV